MVHLRDVLSLCDKLEQLYFNDKYEDFKLILLETDPYLLDVFLNIGFRSTDEDLVERVREILFCYTTIYFKYRTRINTTRNIKYINFTLRNIDDMLMFYIVMKKLIYIYSLSQKDFCKCFENMPELLFDKIDYFRENSYMERDSPFFKRCMKNAKDISFEYFNNLKPL